jgi:hypothetical protein
LISLHVVETRCLELSGFAFSEAEILRRRQRTALVRAARDYNIHGKLPKQAPKPDVEAPLRAA